MIICCGTGEPLPNGSGSTRTRPALARNVAPQGRRHQWSKVDSGRLLDVISLSSAARSTSAATISRNMHGMVRVLRATRVAVARWWCLRLATARGARGCVWARAVRNHLNCQYM
jgi:hypothetical protein